MFEIFCDWFEGKWTNNMQVMHNPRAAAYVHVLHERTSNNTFHCSYKYNKARFPYREYDCSIWHNDGEIIVKSGAAELGFMLESGCFRHRSTERGINYIERDIYLGQNHYHVMDKCVDPEGNLIWGLEGNEFFWFDRAL